MAFQKDDEDFIPDKEYLSITPANEDPKPPAEGYTAKKLTLDNYEEWSKPFFEQLVVKTKVLYFKPLNQLAEFMRTAPLDDFPLGEFVQAKKGYKLESKAAYRETLYKLIPVFRKDTSKPIPYESFEFIFDQSLKDDIEFELGYYHVIFKDNQNKS